MGADGGPCPAILAATAAALDFAAFDMKPVLTCMHLVRC
jgi:hypothetical protein